MFEINLSDYDYELPESRIAKYPLEDRAGSKLLFVDKKKEKIRNFVENFKKLK